MDIFQMLSTDGPALQWTVAAAKGFIILAAAAGGCYLLRGVSAAFLHLCWTLALAAVLVLPLMEPLLPKLDVELLPASAASARGAAWDGQQASFETQSLPVMDETLARADWNRTTTDGSQRVTAAQAPGSDASGSGPTRLPGLSGLVLAVWALGVFLLLIRAAIGLLRAHRLVRRGVAIDDPAWLEMLAEMIDRLDVRRPVRLLRTTDVGVPLACGVGRPAVLIPASAEGWSAEQRRCVLAHELAHVKRQDCLTQALASVACAVHWFNPLVWHAAREMRREREKACDAAVLASARTRASAYAGYLLDIARGAGHGLRVSSAVVQMAKRSHLEGRVLSILEGRASYGLRRAPAAAVIGSGAVLVLALAAMRPAAATDAARDGGGGSVAPRTVASDAVRETYRAGDADLTASPTAVAAIARGSGSVTADMRAPGRTAATTSSAGAEMTAGNDGGAAAADTGRMPMADVVKRSFAVSPGGTLEIDTDAGNIRVETGDQNTVSIEVRRTPRGTAEESDFELAFEQRGADVDVTGRRRGGSAWGRSGVRVDFLITVPRRYNVDLETSGGNITVEDLEGVADVNTAGGNLTFGRISGAIDARTSGGNVTVEATDGNVDVETSGGNIRLGRVGGTVNVHTSGGNISVEEVGGNITAVTSGGRIEARIAGQPTGDCLLRTSGGSIAVHLAEGIRVNLDAETSAGHVDTDIPVQVSGTVERHRLRGAINGGGPALVLDTSAGDIDIRRL